MVTMDDDEQDGKILALVKDGYKCINHKEMEEKLAELREKVSDMGVIIANLKENKADREELWKVREKLMELQEGMTDVKYTLTEIKNNSIEDRERLKELIGELTKTNNEMCMLKRDYAIMVETNDKMNMFFETSPSFIVAKMIRNFSASIDKLKKSSKIMKVVVDFIIWGVLIFVIWSFINVVMIIFNHTLPIEKVIELIRLLLGK